jgi:hypothetical protein
MGAIQGAFLSDSGQAGLGELRVKEDKNGCSSIGRVAVSKTVGWEFESLHPCKGKIDGKTEKLYS